MVGLSCQLADRTRCGFLQAPRAASCCGDADLQLGVLEAESGSAAGAVLARWDERVGRSELANVVDRQDGGRLFFCALIATPPTEGRMGHPREDYFV